MEPYMFRIDVVCNGKIKDALERMNFPGMLEVDVEEIEGLDNKYRISLASDFRSPITAVAEFLIGETQDFELGCTK